MYMYMYMYVYVYVYVYMWFIPVMAKLNFQQILQKFFL